MSARAIVRIVTPEGTLRLHFVGGVESAAPRYVELETIGPASIDSEGDLTVSWQVARVIAAAFAAIGNPASVRNVDGRVYTIDGDRLTLTTDRGGHEIAK